MMELFKNRLGIGLVLFYIAGIFTGTHSFSVTFIIISILLTVFFVILGFLCLRDTKRAVSLGAALCLVFLIFGTLYSSFTAENRQKELRGYIEKNCTLYGTVITSPELTNKGNHYSVTVDVHKINDTYASGRIILYVSRLDNTAPRVNQCIYFNTALSYPDYKDGNFNYNEYLRTRDIYAEGFTERVYPYTGYDRPDDIISKFKRLGRSINLFFCDKIEALFGYDQDAQAIMKGVLLGEKEDFSKELTTNLSMAGFSHIAAVSGLHLNILFGALCGLLGFFMIHRKLMVLITLPAILLFASITGFTPSVCRSVIMLIVCLIALVFKREYDSLSALFLSAFIILTVNPYALYSISFILSFMSTLAIIVLYPVIYGIFRLTSKSPAVLRWIISSLSVSASAFIGTVPFIGYYFGIVSLASFIANIWVIPLVAPIFIIGYLLCLVLAFLPEILCSILLYPVAAMVDILIKTASLFARASFLHFNVNSFSPVWILIYFIIILIIYKFAQKCLKD